MKKYTTLLWDVDMTLLDFDASERYAIHTCFSRLGHPVEDDVVDLYHQINDAVWKKIEKGELDKKTALRMRFEQLFEAIGMTDILPGDFQALYQVELGSVYFYLERSNELLARLQGKYHQYLITNGVASTQKNKIYLAGLDTLTDQTFISEEMGYPKPQREYFEACFQKMPGITPEECLIIGDSLTSDMLGGKNMGIDTCWYNPKHKENTMGLPITYEIDSLWKVPDLLEK